MHALLLTPSTSGLRWSSLWDRWRKRGGGGATGILAWVSFTFSFWWVFFRFQFFICWFTGSFVWYKSWTRIWLIAVVWGLNVSSQLVGYPTPLHWMESWWSQRPLTLLTNPWWLFAIMSAETIVDQLEPNKPCYFWITTPTFTKAAVQFPILESFLISCSVVWYDDVSAIR